MSQQVRASSSKTKRSNKERDKRKSLAGSQDTGSVNTNDKTAPTKEVSSKRYPGLSTENIRVAAEHVTFPELLSEDALEVLTEDLNYKLRYIIHQAANRAFVSNRTGINRSDVDETLADLQLDKIYGAPSDPTWIPIADQNCLILDDPKVNMIEEAEEEVSYSQCINPVIKEIWLTEPKESNSAFKNYFKVICEAVVSYDFEVRRMALQNISSNPNLGPIINWLYRFGYLLLSKDVTYDSLTLYALDLIETLELCPIGNSGADENQLKLLVRLILQRLLKSYTNTRLLKPMCWVLAILCGRQPLKELVTIKLKEKLPELAMPHLLPFLMLVNALGIEAVMDIFVRNFDFLFAKLHMQEESLMNNGHDATSYVYDWQICGLTLMETYCILFKNNIFDKTINVFPELENFSILLSRPLQACIADEIIATDFIGMKKQLIKTRRKLEASYHCKFLPYETVFDVPVYRTRMKQKIENHYKTNYHIGWKKQTHVIIGKISLLLPVMKNADSKLPICCDHSLFSYNF